MPQKRENNCLAPTLAASHSSLNMSWRVCVCVRCWQRGCMQVTRGSAHHCYVYSNVMLDETGELLKPMNNI